MIHKEMVRRLALATGRLSNGHCDLQGIGSGGDNGPAYIFAGNIRSWRGAHSTKRAAAYFLGAADAYKAASGDVSPFTEDEERTVEQVRAEIWQNMPEVAREQYREGKEDAELRIQGHGIGS